MLKGLLKGRCQDLAHPATAGCYWLSLRLQHLSDFLISDIDYQRLWHFHVLLCSTPGINYMPNIRNNSTSIPQHVIFLIVSFYFNGPILNISELVYICFSVDCVRHLMHCDFKLINVRCDRISLWN